METELKLTFDKPEVLEAISAYHFDLFEFDSLNRRSIHLKLAQRLCFVVGSLCFLGFIVPLVIALNSDEGTLSKNSWPLLAAAIIATVVLIILVIYALSTKRRLTALVQHGPETS